MTNTDATSARHRAPAAHTPRPGGPAALAEAVADVAAALAAAGLGDVLLVSLRALNAPDHVVVEVYLRDAGQGPVDAAGDALGLQGERDHPSFYVRAGSFRGVEVQVYSAAAAVRRLQAVRR